MKKILGLLLFCAMQTTMFAMDNNNNNARNRKNNSANLNENKEEQDICAVCRGSVESEESEEKEPCTKLSCTHAFHSNCIKLWAEKNSNCPLCRAVLTDEELKNLDVKERAHGEQLRPTFFDRLEQIDLNQIMNGAYAQGIGFGLGFS